MEELDFDSELLTAVRERIENTINKLLLIAAKTGKESEMTLKINISCRKRNKKSESDKKIEWLEPELDYQISEKIKEDKNSYKGLSGYDYELKIDKNDNVYVQKINEQTSMF